MAMEYAILMGQDLTPEQLTHKFDLFNTLIITAGRDEATNAIVRAKEILAMVGI